MEKAKLTEGMFTSRTDEWSTPQHIFDELNKEFSFSLDAAAQKENAKCEIFFSELSLMKDWTKFNAVFLNPPYSQNYEFMQKAYEAGQRTIVVVLTPCRTDTKWWHEFAMKADEIRFIQGRLKYNDAEQSAPFPSAIVIFRPFTDTRFKMGSPLAISVKFREGKK